MAWDNAPLKDAWAARRDHDFAIQAMALVPVEVTALGASGRVLEVAAAEAEHASQLNLRGLACVVLEPSAAMLVRARERMAALGARLTFVRGIAETLPFRDGSFDRVLSESAIDTIRPASTGRSSSTAQCRARWIRSNDQDLWMDLGEVT